MSFTRTGILLNLDECYCSSTTSTAYEGVRTITCAKHVAELREQIAKEIIGYFAHKDRPMDCVEQIQDGNDNCNFVEEVAEFVIAREK